MYNRWKKHAAAMDKEAEELERHQLLNHYIDRFPKHIRPIRYRRRPEPILDHINEVDQSEYVLKLSDIETYIVKALSNGKQSISYIIDKIESLGYKFNTTHHKYNSIHRVLNKNFYMFRKHGKGFYSLRQGYQCIQNKKSIQKKKQHNSSIPTLKQVIENVAAKYIHDMTITPSIMHNIMKRMGYNCSYSSVRSAMLNSDKFIHNNRAYRFK